MRERVFQEWYDPVDDWTTNRMKLNDETAAGRLSEDGHPVDTVLDTFVKV